MRRISFVPVRVATAVLLALAHVEALAGADHPWNELEGGSSGDVVGGLVLLAVIAFAIHLIEKGEFFGFLRDIAKGLSFLAAMYLAVFWFIACIFMVAFALRAIGIEKSTAGLIAFPLGLVVAYKLYAAYESWRSRKPPQ